ncbi:MAG: protein kinase [Anaerolineales bacterium]|jgi:serine/threonine-protein kinase
MSFIPGENVGPYRITQQLGQGGMATVFKAYHAALDRYVALKVLHPAFKEDPSFLGRFRREARVVAKLDHPNIVPIYDYAEHEGQPFLVMKFIEGQTLKARLGQGPLGPQEALHIVRCVGSALSYAHKQGVLHRDIKPSNVLLTPDGSVFLADFGLARIATVGESTLSSDMLLGTPHYISPEQAKGLRNLDEGTDIYSLGVVLYEISVGRVPFNADTPFSIIHDHIFTPLPMPRSLNPKVPEGVERVLLKALAKERADRHPDVQSLVDAFVAAVENAGAGVQAVTTKGATPASAGPQAAIARGSPKPSPKTSRRSPFPWWIWVIVAAGVCVCLAILVALALLGRAERTAPSSNPTPLVAAAPTGIPLPAAAPTGVPVPVATPTGPVLPAAPTSGSVPLGSPPGGPVPPGTPLDPQARQALADVNQGISDLNGGQLDAASQEFEAAREVYPGDHPAIYRMMAKELESHQAWLEALRFYVPLLEGNPEERDLRQVMEASLFFSGEDSRAASDLQQVVGIAPQWGVSLAAWARWEAHFNNRPSADQDILKAQSLSEEPKAPFVRAVAGEMELMEGRAPEGTATLKSVATDPRSPGWLIDEVKRILAS